MIVPKANRSAAISPALLEPDPKRAAAMHYAGKIRYTEPALRGLIAAAQVAASDPRQDRPRLASHSCFPMMGNSPTF